MEKKEKKAGIAKMPDPAPGMPPAAVEAARELWAIHSAGLNLDELAPLARLIGDRRMAPVWREIAKHRVALLGAEEPDRRDILLRRYFLRLTRAALLPLAALSPGEKKFRARVLAELRVEAKAAELAADKADRDGLLAAVAVLERQWRGENLPELKQARGKWGPANRADPRLIGLVIELADLHRRLFGGRFDAAIARLCAVILDREVADGTVREIWRHHHSGESHPPDCPS